MEELIRQLRNPPDSPYGIREDLMEEAANMIDRLRSAAELARKRLLDVVRNGDAEPEDVEAYEALHKALSE